MIKYKIKEANRKGGMRNSNSHNRLVVGSIPTEPTFEAKSSRKASDSFKKPHVLPETNELLHLRELLHILLGNKGRRHLLLEIMVEDEEKNN